MALNTEALAKELQLRHQVGIKPDDPVFLLLTLNELLLANYQEQFQTLLDTQSKQQAVQATKAVELHLQESTDHANRLFKAMQEDFEKTKAELKEVFQGQLTEIRTEKEKALKDFQEAAKVLQKYGYIVALCFGALLGFIFRGFLPH